MLRCPLQQLLLILQAGRGKKLQNLVDQQIWESGDWQRFGSSSKLVEKAGGEESASKESKGVEQAYGEGEDEGGEECRWQQEQEGRVPPVSEKLLGHGVGFCRGCWLNRVRWLSNLGCWRERMVGGDTILAHAMHQMVGKWVGGICNGGGDRGNFSRGTTVPPRKF